MDRLRAQAYLDLLNEVPAGERIAHGLLSAQVPADDQAKAGAQEGGPRPGGDDCPCDECDGTCQPDDDSDPDDGPDDDNPGDGGPGSSGGPVDDGGNPGDGDSEPPGGGDSPGLGAEPPAPSPAGGPAGPRPVLQDLVLPLATLLGQAERPGEGHGLGALDPDLCRALAATAARSPRTTICLTITDPDGTAIGHGCARPARPARPAPRGPATYHGGPAPPPVTLPARINLTATAGHLARLPAAATGPPGATAPPGTPAADGWALTPDGGPGTRGARGARAAAARPGDPDWCRTWTLTAPGGQQFTVRTEPVPTHDCDHRHESHAYQPSDRLRHLVQVRDYTCTFPTCSRHARDSDFEHAVPYDKGGRTCACNAGARSRQCHRVKQSPGWKVTQPRPGWHQWQTPRGRTYTQGPKRYPV
jgi:hypothetical protein